MPNDFWKKALDWFIQNASWEVLKSWAYWACLLLGTLGAVVLGLAASYDWFLIYVGSTVVLAMLATMFAMTTIGLLRFDERHHRTTTKDKLTFSNVRFTTNSSVDSTLLSIQMGVDLMNQALFPIQLSVQEIHSKLHPTLGELNPIKIDRKNDEMTMAPSGTGWCNDNPIQLDSNTLMVLRNTAVDGLIHVRLLYGRPNKLNRELYIKKRFVVVFTGDGAARLDHWYDA